MNYEDLVFELATVFTQPLLILLVFGVLFDFLYNLLFPRERW